MTTREFRCRTLLFVVAIVTACASATQAQAARATIAAPRIDTAAVLASAKPEIEAANTAWLPGLRTRDADIIVAAYADSGLFIGPDGVVIRGRQAVRQLYASRFPRMREIRDGGVVQDGLVVASPDLIYEWGHAWVEMAAATPGGPPVKSGGGYLTVWRREADGHWRITRNIAL